MGEFLLFLISLFSIVNPFSSIPTYVSMTVGVEGRERRMMVSRTAVAVFAILAVSYLTGEGLLRFFSISVPSLRVAGGMVILGMGWSMVQAKVSGVKQTPEEAEESIDRSAVAIVPLAMPILAGPGSISLMIIVAGQTNGVVNHLLVLLAAASVSFVAWLVLLAAVPIAGALGKTGMNVATRFMGLILLATSVEFITSGLSAIFPGWAG